MNTISKKRSCQENERISLVSPGGMSGMSGCSSIHLGTNAAKAKPRTRTHVSTRPTGGEFNRFTPNVEVNRSKEGAAPASQETCLTQESVPTIG